MTSESPTQISGNSVEEGPSAQVSEFLWQHKELFTGLAKAANFDSLFKMREEDPSPSSQPASEGYKSHPFNRRAVINFKNTNTHHSRCIETKVASTVGLGHENEKVAESLDPLCGDDGWQSIQSDLCEDYWQVGDGYLEVVREMPGGPITGLHHLPSADVNVVVDTRQTKDYHYEFQSREGEAPIKMARFGDSEDLQRRLKDKKIRSEIINVSRPTSLSKWYGYPDWLAGVQSVELVQMLDQYTFDFFLNRCVPEFLLLFTGGTIAPPTWKAINDMFKKNIGLGNSHKSCALNIPGEVKGELLKLGLDAPSEGTMYSDYNETLGLRIVSAHGVPLALANIPIPGKLGATNELPNALMAFQALLIGPAQRTFTSKWDVTLGNPKLNGGGGGKPGRPKGTALKRGDFVYKKITDEIIDGLMSSVGQQTGESRGNPLATVGGMKTALPVAAAQGRNLNGGLKD